MVGHLTKYTVGYFKFASSKSEQSFFLFSEKTFKKTFEKKKPFEAKIKLAGPFHQLN